MAIRKVRKVAGALPLALALALAGCQSAQPQAPASNEGAIEAADRANEARRIADATLGKQSEILAQGDLAKNGREQLLVVNRVSKDAAGATGENPSSIFFTRAAIFEKDGGKWTEILRCDEHLKNPNGYLGGAPSARVAGWRLEYSPDTTNGLEMKFTPRDAASGQQKVGGQDATVLPVAVRWNKAAKRYESLDRSQKKFLAELPALEAEPSVLK